MDGRDLNTPPEFPDAEPQAKTPEAELDRAKMGMKVSKSKTLLSNLYNAKHLLKGLTSLRELFAFNEFTRRIIVKGEIPGSKALLGEELTDEHVLFLQAFMQDIGLSQISKTTVLDAIIAVARENAFNPIRDELLAYQWDGTPRLDTWLHDYLGVEDTEYTRLVGRWTLISMVARVMSPGADVHTMLILEGLQGVGKSRVCAILAGGKVYFTDDVSLHQIGNKDLLLNLQGKLVVEWAELSGMRKAEQEAVKAFLTRSVDKFRAPYERIDKELPRQGIFIGTTNATAYLDDDTGGRRFWPVRVTNIDIAALERDRAQLMAEAVMYYSNGVRWFPTPEEQARIFAPEQADRQKEGDPWLEPVQGWIIGKIQKGDATPFSGTDVLTKCLLLEAKMQTRREQMRVAAILKSLGLEKCGDTSVRRYKVPTIHPLREQAAEPKGEAGAKPEERQKGELLAALEKGGREQIQRETLAEVEARLTAAFGPDTGLQVMAVATATSHGKATPSDEVAALSDGVAGSQSGGFATEETAPPRWKQ